MSFDVLQQANVVRKKKDVVLKVGEKEVTFTANEVSYMQRIHLATIQHGGGDPFTQLLVYSITDEQGKHMTLEQANSLPPEYAEPLFLAASEVNNSGVPEVKN